MGDTKWECCSPKLNEQMTVKVFGNVPPTQGMDVVGWQWCRPSQGKAAKGDCIVWVRAFLLWGCLLVIFSCGIASPATSSSSFLFPMLIHNSEGGPLCTSEEASYLIAAYKWKKPHTPPFSLPLVVRLGYTTQSNPFLPSALCFSPYTPPPSNSLPTPTI